MILRHWHNQQSFQSEMEKETYQMTQTHTKHCQTYHWKNNNNKKGKRWKYRKDDSSDASSSDDSDLSDNSDYRRKQRKRKSDKKKGSDQIMRTFNGKVADASI